MTSRHTMIAQFSERHRLRLKRDCCGECIVPGKFGHLYEHNAALMGLSLEDGPRGKSRARCLLKRKRQAIDAGFRLHQTGEAESILLFEVRNAAQELMAVKLVGARRRRRASPAQLKALVRAREALKFQKVLAQRAVRDSGTHGISRRPVDPTQRLGHSESDGESHTRGANAEKHAVRIRQMKESRESHSETHFR